MPQPSRATLTNRRNAARAWLRKKSDHVWLAKRSATTAAWKRRNRDHVNAAQRAWLAANPDKKRASRKRSEEKRKSDPNKRTRKRAYRKPNTPRARAIRNLRWRLRDLVKRGKAVSCLPNTLTGCTAAFLVTYLAVRFLEGMDWSNYGTAWVIDHVKPCAKYDLTKRREVEKCFHFTNLQPLWKKVNHEKLDRVPTQTELAI
jgi:hypothetical protein